MFYLVGIKSINQHLTFEHKNTPGEMAGGHKKVILLFAGTAWLWSCRFLFHQFVHGDKAHKVIRDADALSALPAALVRRFDVDALDKFP